MPQILARTLVYLPAQVVGPLSQFLAAVVWTYFLAPEALGTYAIIWAVQELVLLGALSWWSAHAMRYMSSFETPERRLAFDGTEIAVQIGAAMLQAVMALFAVWLVLDTPITGELLAATLAFTLTRNLTSHFGDRARALFQTTAYTILQSFGSFGGLVLGILAMMYWAPTPENLLWAYAAAQTVGLLIALPMIKVTTARPAPDRAILLAAWTYGAPLMLGNAITWIATHAIRFIVEFDLGPAAVGLVSVGWWLGLRATTFAGLLVTAVAFNMAVERMRAEGPQAGLPIIATNGAMLAAVLLPTVVGVWMLNDALVTTLVAEPYRDVTALILPIAVATGAIRVFRMHGTDQCFLLFERPKLDVYVSVVDAVATVLLCYVGWRFGGYHGAVLGCLAAAVLTAIVSFVVARVGFGYYVRVADVARIVVAVLAMAVALHALPTTGTRVGVATEVIAAGTVYLAVLAAMFPSQSSQMLRRLAKRVTGAGPA